MLHCLLTIVDTTKNWVLRKALAEVIMVDGMGISASTKL